MTYPDNIVLAVDLRVHGSSQTFFAAPVLYNGVWYILAFRSGTSGPSWVADDTRLTAYVKYVQR